MRECSRSALPGEGCDPLAGGPSTVRELALAVLTRPGLADKLAPPPAELSDREPGPAVRVPHPARPPELRIVPAARARVPPLAGMADPAQRRRILHAFCNHELQAVELCAWALLAFPDAPPAMRAGLVRVLADEQRHTRMYLERLAALGVEFGTWPVSGYFWNKLARIETPLQFVCAMALTFENANLDHAPEYAAAARAAGDLQTAALLERIEADEVHHVRFGVEWLRRLKRPQESLWEAYLRNTVWPLGPHRARGQRFRPEGRLAAGLDADFVQRLAASGPC